MGTLTERGLEIDKLGTVIDKIQDSLDAAFFGILPSGDKIVFDDSSIMYRLMLPIAEIITSQEELLQQVYANCDISTATGLALENLCALGGVTRGVATPSFCQLNIVAAINTTILKGSLASSPLTGDRFATLSTITAGLSANIGVDWRLNSVGTNHNITFKWSVDGSPNTNVPIEVAISASKTTAEAIAIIASAINATTTNLIATAMAGDLLRVELTDKNNTASFTFLGADPVNTICPVFAENTSLGRRPQDRETIVTIDSPVLGWLSVSNPFDAEVGREVETDDLLRQSYASRIGKDGAGSLNSMYSALYSLRGVRYVSVMNNKSNSIVSGVDPHSVAVVVSGGAPEAIVNTIFNNLPLGVSTTGTDEYTVKDINDGDNIIRYSTPSLVPIKVNLILSLEKGFPENGVALIQQAIVDYIGTLSIGDDILYSRLFTPINTVSGFSVNSMKIATLNGVFGTENLVIRYDQQATISFSDITFTSGV